MIFRLVGFLVSLATFPGVIVHEVAHLFFCRRAGLAVYGYSLLRLGNPMGFVVHEPPARLRDTLSVTVAPVIINTLGAVLLAWVFASLGWLAAFGLVVMGGTEELAYESLALIAGIGMWLGVSLGTHAFPSLGDARSLWESVTSGRHGTWGWILGAPVAGAILAGSVASFFWLDVLYGFALAYLGRQLASSLAENLGAAGLSIAGASGFVMATLFTVWVAVVAFRARESKLAVMPTLQREPRPTAGPNAPSLPTPRVPFGAPLPAGWYSNPKGVGRRYWDGSRWTSHVVQDAAPESLERGV